MRRKWSELSKLPKFEILSLQNLVGKSYHPTSVTKDGRGAFLMQWSFTVRKGGALRSENADISNDSPDENSGCRMPKVSSATWTGWGLLASNRIAQWFSGMYKQLIFCYRYIRVITLLMTKSATQGLLYGGLSNKSFRKIRRVVNTSHREMMSLKT